MLKAKYLVPMSLLLVFLYLKFVVYQPPAERQHLVFKDSAKSVQDSMMLLRQICESVEAKNFMNCYVQPSDSTLYFNAESIGRFDSVSVSNKAFKNMKRADVSKLLSLMKFLKRNFIVGLYHDTTGDFWLYTYRADIYYNTTTTIRNIYIWSVPKDTLSPTFMYFFKIVDRKERMVLIGRNYVPYKQFPK